MASGCGGRSGGDVGYDWMGLAAFCAGGGRSEARGRGDPCGGTTELCCNRCAAGDDFGLVAENENDAQFIRLPYANDGAAVENDAIVRAVLPRSALASLGFPVGDVSGAEPVPVELMVSEDGTPEAIRLVAQDVEE